MKHRFFITLALLTVLIISCKGKSQKIDTQLEEDKASIGADWIVGQWIHFTEEGALCEDWVKMNDSIYHGKSYLLANDDTLFSETLTLQIKQDSLIYSSLNLQTKQFGAKEFRGKYPTEDYFQVRNEQQAFPKSIKYQSLNDTLLMIEIGGIIDGEEEIQPYQMVRRLKS